MTPAEQDRAFKKAVKLAAGERGAIQDATAREVVRLLNEAGAAVTAALEAQPSDFMAWYLPQLQKQIEQTLSAFGEDAGQAATAGQTKAWGAGQALIDKPLAAAQVRLIAELPRLDTRPLLAMQLFLTGIMKAVGLDTLNRVNGELALTVIGAQGVATTIERIQEVMGGVSRRRAITIVRTELGRAFAAASQQRAEQAAVHVPGLKKQWRRSGKIHSRRKHDLTDGQVRPVKEPFILGTGHVSDPATHGGIRIMYPHDPAAPPAETINCGCISLPFMDSWKDAGVLQDPGKRPFSEEEIRLNPVKQELAGPGLTMGEIIKAREDAGLNIRYASEEAKPAVVLDAPRVRRVLREVEQRIAGEKVEVAVVLDRSGSVVSEVRGDADRVAIPALGLKDAIVTHTHVYVGSFSEGDIRSAMTHELAEIRAVDPWYTYIMRPSLQGWNEALWTGTVEPMFQQLEAETVGQSFDLMADPDAFKEFMGNAQHGIWRKVARATGLRYTRRKRV